MTEFDWRHLSLDAPALIEASAGTGKTYTIALLYLRLVCESEVAPGSVLVSTFTELAASELTERIGARLKQALRSLAGVDNDVELRAYLSTLDPARVRTRLALALNGLERAPIGTIHAFCRRVLRDFPEDTGRGLTLGQAVSGTALIDECVEDFWRRRVLPDADPMLVHADLGKLKHNVRELLAAGDARVDAPALGDFQFPARLRTPKAIAVFRSVASDPRRVAKGKTQISSRLRELAARLERGQEPDPKWCEQAAKQFTLANLRAQQVAPDGLTSVSWFAELQAYAHARLHPDTVVSAALAREALEAVKLDIERRLDARDAHTFDALIDGVLRALDGPRGDILAERLRQHYSAALIDEFQDTDPRQWRVFQRLFGERFLLLIGDPKQAIYRFRGGDLLTYLAAKENIPAQRQFHLRHNFRSDPPLLDALNTLYAGAGRDPFGGAGIQYVPLLAGHPERACAADQAPLRIRRFGSTDASKASRDAAALTACADDIVDLLNTPTPDAYGPGDIAVLLSTNQQIATLRTLLDARGVPVAATSTSSVFAGDVASDVQLLLYALLHLHRESARRAALATRLLRLDARQLAQLDTDPVLQNQWALCFSLWRQAYDDGGIAAVLAHLEREHGPTWRRSDNGERIATDVRHLLELAVEVQALSPPEQYAWWQTQRQHAADGLDSEAGRERMLRIASDGERVQLLTVHKSKGLEFPVVFVPMAWRPPRDKAPPLLRVAEAGERIYDLGGPRYDERKLQHQLEDDQENGRRLYVALTRAVHRLVIYTDAQDFADSRPGELSALVRLEPIVAPHIDDRPVAPRVRTPRWQAPPVSAAAPTAIRPWPTLPARIAQLSFSALTRHLDAAPRAADEAQEIAPSTPDGSDPHPELLAIDHLRGPRFGNAVHRLLEEQRAFDDLHHIGEALEAEGQPPIAAPLVGALLSRTRQADLGGGLRLIDLRPSAQRAELGFQFRVRAGRTDELFALAGHRGSTESLRGAMVGFIDMVIHWQQRYHLLDYKSNALGLQVADYEGASLQRAMHHHQYDLQALIYAVALHRYLGYRLDDYDPNQHLGDVIYLFVRGIGLKPGAGVFRQSIDVQQVLAADQLLEGDSSSERHGFGGPSP